MESSASQRSFQDIIETKRFPAKLWNLVNDPANNAIFWDSRGEIVIINQFLFEKEVLSQGCEISDRHFKSFHRQLNLYGFEKIRSKVIKGGCKYFQNPKFKREHPELLHKMTRKPVKNRVNAVANQKRTQQLPDQNQHGGEGSNPTCSSDQPAVHYQLGQYLPDFHQQHLEYSTQSFSHTGFYQSTQCLIPSGLEESTQVLTPGETSELTLDDSDMELLLKIANEMMQCYSPINCPVQVTDEVKKT
uniref:HSF-type DNA-binding domain-containing protein n=1 Tax=Gouania willdenowi TaxID=441366 RepID=A0A8C5DGX2_GOUWI